MTARPIPYGDSDNKYLNIVIRGQPSKDTPARYSSTSTDIILNNGADYYLSIIRFSIPTNTIPLMIFPIQEGTNNDINLGTFSFTLTFMGNSLQEYLIFFPVVSNVPLPKSPANNNGKQDLTTTYYYVFDPSQLVTIMNNALASLFANFIIMFGPFPVGVTQPPYLLYDDNTEKLTFIVQDTFITNNLLLSCNSLLFNYLQYFVVKFNGYNAPFDADFDFLFSLRPSQFPNYDNYYYPDINVTPYPPVFLKFTQQISVLDYWTDFRSLVFVTNLLPIAQEIYPTNQIINNPNDNSGNFQYIPILTDFSPQGIPGPIVEYNPTAQYRLIDIISTGPVQGLDMQIYWRDINSNLYPVLIASTAVATIKIAFLKKSIYNTLYKSQVY